MFFKFLTHQQLIVLILDVEVMDKLGKRLPQRTGRDTGLLPDETSNVSPITPDM